MKTLDYSVPLNGSVAEEHSTGIYKKSQTVVDKIFNLRGGFAIVALTAVSDNPISTTTSGSMSSTVSSKA